MKNLRNFGLALSLLLMPTLNAFAGDMNFPVVPPATSATPQTQAVLVNESVNSNITGTQGQDSTISFDAITNYANALVQSFGCIF